MTSPKPKTPTQDAMGAEGVEPVDLMDDYWFFHNPLKKKNRMFRSASDPYPSSSNIDQVFGRIESKVSPKKSLQRAPSLPISLGRARGGIEEKEAVRTRGTSNKLTRQFSLCTPLTVPPRRAYKIALTSPVIAKHQEPTPKIRTPRSPCPNNVLKSPRELEIEEVQGFKDLGFDFSKIDLTPDVKSIVPGLRSNKPDDWDQSKVKRPYLSEAWLAQTFTTVTAGCLMPDCVDFGCPNDVKKCLKQWARVVATKVRQEC